jgi:hypothetical protein
MARQASRSQAQGRRVMTDTGPSGALTWGSSAERNRQLTRWRRAVFSIFGDRPRVIRVAWVLSDLFNIKRGYAFPSNAYLAEETNMAVNKLRATLGILESGGAIIRAEVINPATGQTQRVIHPATAIIPRTALGHGGRSPTLGQRGEPQQPGHQNLRRIPRIQSSQIALAQADSTRRDERNRHGKRGPASAPDLAPEQVAAPQDGYPRSEATGDGQRLPLAKQDARGAGIERAAAADRSCDASGGIALERADDPERRVRSPEEGKEEEGEWTL